MDEIPEDVLQIGIRIAEDIPSRVCSMNRAFAARVIARAILAERKRCADVARSYGTAPGLPDGKSGAFRKHRHAIASAIESGQ